MPLDVFYRRLVLLVEDQPLIALRLEHHLRQAGARVIAAGDLDAGLAMSEHPDLAGAIVDVHLGAESAMPIWRRLIRRNLSFVVHTDCPSEAIRLRWPSIPIVRKPATGHEITAALSFALSNAAEPQLDHAL